MNRTDFQLIGVIHFTRSVGRELTTRNQTIIRIARACTSIGRSVAYSRYIFDASKRASLCLFVPRVTFNAFAYPSPTSTMRFFSASKNRSNFFSKVGRNVDDLFVALREKVLKRSYLGVMNERLRAKKPFKHAKN